MNIDSALAPEIRDGWNRGGEHHIQKGRFTIYATPSRSAWALTKGPWIFTLADGNTLATTGTAMECKAEADRRG